MRLRIALLVLVGLTAAPAMADEAPATAERIVTLSPHLAELVFAVGAGERLIGVSAYTDYPEAAANLPLVGDAFMLDMERLAVLEPDLLLAWQSGTPEHVIDEIRSHGYRVEVITTTSLDDIPRALRRIGALTGHGSTATVAADSFTTGLAALQDRARGSAPIAVFYQISARPLYTVNGDHYVSELIELCGGRNIFADLGKLAPLIGVEAVLERDPEVILAADDTGRDVFAEWDRWPGMAFNRYGNRFSLPAAQTGRATPRLLDAAAAICDALEQSRRNRGESGD